MNTRKYEIISTNSINEENPTYCTMVAETREEKKVLFNAVQNPSAKVSEFINQQITFWNVHMEHATFEDEDTGNTVTGIKTVLITPDGKGIIAHSMGVAKSVAGIINMFGTPDQWYGEPMTVIVRQTETKNGRYFQLEVV